MRTTGSSYLHSVLWNTTTGLANTNMRISQVYRWHANLNIRWKQYGLGISHESSRANENSIKASLLLPHFSTRMLTCFASYGCHWILAIIHQRRSIWYLHLSLDGARRTGVGLDSGFTGDLAVLYVLTPSGGSGQHNIFPHTALSCYYCKSERHLRKRAMDRERGRDHHIPRMALSDCVIYL